MSELTILCSLDQAIIDKAKGFAGHSQKQPWFSPAIVLPKNARFINVVRYDEAQAALMRKQAEIDHLKARLAEWEERHT